MVGGFAGRVGTFPSATERSCHRACLTATKAQWRGVAWREGTYDVPVVEGEISVEDSRQWVDHPEESALDLVLNHNHIFVQGLAGTGKSWLVKKLVRTLRERGERVQCCALTHVAAKNIGGCTTISRTNKFLMGVFRVGW